VDLAGRVIGSTSQDDANSLLYDAQRLAGSYGLEALSEETVLERVVERYGDVEGLSGLVQCACQHVWSKWSSDGHMTGAAEDWAMDLIAEYAKQDGIELVDSWDDAGEEEEEEEMA
jgi:hypothetical protein